MKRPARPTVVSHSTWTSRVLASGGKGAGFGPLGLEQAATSAAARAMPNRRISAPEGLEPHAHALAEGAVLLVGLLQRELVRAPGRLDLVLREEQVAAQRGVLRVVGGAVLGLEELERLVVGFLIEQQRGEPQAREIAEIVGRRTLDHPLQL